ncbi:hypothetical protein B0H14DRAFT_2613330 [Mycena olivaceomarginata]|nr:hypothetical protein B0H14DRAFT_2613330 [Mycena olivaceomarginata]
MHGHSASPPSLLGLTLTQACSSICAMVTFGDETTYGRVLEYSQRLDESDKDSPDGAMMEFILQESMTFGNGLACPGDTSKTHSDPEYKPPVAIQPYGPPPVFNIDDIGILMNSQYEFAVQHLADLRTDPIYLAENLQAYYEHRIEIPPWQSASIAHASAFLAYYHVAKEIIHDFCIVQANFPNGPLRARELTKEYEDALKKLHQSWVSSKSASARHITRRCITIRSTDAAFRQHGFTFASRPDDKLYTFLAFLLQENKTHLWQVGRIFDQLDRLTQDPAAHRRISPPIASILSQWGVINNFKSILASHRPAVDATELLPAGFEQRLQKWKPLIGPVILGIDPDPALAARAFPISNFTYPKGPRDSTWAAKCEDRCGNELFALGTQVVGPFMVVPTSWSSLGPRANHAEGGSSGPIRRGGTGPRGEKKNPLRRKPNQRHVGVAAITVESKGNEQATETSVAIAPTPVSARIQTAFAQIGFELQKTRGSAWTFHHPDGPKTVIGSLWTRGSFSLPYPRPNILYSPACCQHVPQYKRYEITDVTTSTRKQIPDREMWNWKSCGLFCRNFVTSAYSRIFRDIVLEIIIDYRAGTTVTSHSSESQPRLDPLQTSACFSYSDLVDTFKDPHLGALFASGDTPAIKLLYDFDALKSINARGKRSIS